MKKRFSWRGFISLYITISFLIIIVSGIILYFAPPGRVANWSYWRFLGLLKSQWQSVHTIFTFIFIIAAGFHLFYNWKPFVAYLKTKFESKIKLRLELIFSIIVILIFFVMVIYDFAPFKSVMDFGEQLKESWSNDSNEPPIPHAEDLLLTEFSSIIKMSADEIKNRLGNENISVPSEDISIKEIAKLNNISPNRIYNLLKRTGSNSNAAAGEGRGFGRKTIQEICIENDINVETAIANLKLKGIEAGLDDKLKDIALRHNLMPVEVANIALGTKNDHEKN
ncbi:MAG TPA: DUF4405 domain-containing protein [Melioribacteraceae bacterium]|nr:DUF4405 domain-containing protein [Melioribacteraceae bacterium]